MLLKYPKMNRTGQKEYREFAWKYSVSSEKEMGTHSSVLAWRIPGTGEPGGLPSMGSHRIGHDWSDLAAAAAFCIMIMLSLSLSYSINLSWDKYHTIPTFSQVRSQQSDYTCIWKKKEARITWKIGKKRLVFRCLVILSQFHSSHMLVK